MSCLKTGALVLALLVPFAASAQSNCADRDSGISKLESGYGEDKGTWTILMTRADGKSCIMASGTNWREGQDVNYPKGIPG